MRCQINAWGNFTAKSVSLPLYSGVFQANIYNLSFYKCCQHAGYEKDNFVNMQDKSVNMQNDYVDMQRKCNQMIHKQ